MTHAAADRVPAFCAWNECKSGQGGQQQCSFSDEIAKAMFEAAADVAADAGSKDLFTKKVYESYSKFRKDALEWTRISNQAYLTKRSL